MELTLVVTNFCEQGCHQCEMNASKEGKFLDYETIFKFLLSHRDGVRRINIIGGEPLAHPDIYKILKMCREICSEVWVYTNMIDNILYNKNVIRRVAAEPYNDRLTLLLNGQTVHSPQATAPSTEEST